jgi:hypothetical protein
LEASPAGRNTSDFAEVDGDGGHSVNANRMHNSLDFPRHASVIAQGKEGVLHG